MERYDIEKSSFLKNPKLTKIVLLLSGMMTVMGGALISPDLPKIQAYFAAVPSIEVITPFVLTIVALSIILFSPVTAKLISKVSKRNIFLASLILYAIGGTAGFYLNNIWAIIISRVLLGAAVGALTSCTLILASDYFHGNERNEFIGILTATMSIGGVIFISASGYLADISWRLPFLIYLFSLVVLPLAILFIPEPKKIVEVTKAVKSVKKVHLNLIILINLLAFLSMVFLYFMTVQMPFYVQVLAIGTSFLSGIIIGTMNLLQAFAGILLGKHIKIKPVQVVEIFFLLESVGFIIISLATNPIILILGAIFCGFGIGMMMASANMWITVVPPDEDRGKYINILNTALYTGQFVSPLFAIPIVNLFGYSAPYGFFAQIGILCLVIAILTIIYTVISTKKGKKNFFTVNELSDEA